MHCTLHNLVQKLHHVIDGGNIHHRGEGRGDDMRDLDQIFVDPFLKKKDGRIYPETKSDSYKIKR